MNIGIIGAGNMGSSLAKLLTGAGYQVAIADNGSGKAEQVANDNAPSVRATSVQVAAEISEVVVLAIPFDAAAQLLQQLAETLSGKIVIDITNPISADYMSLTLGHSTSAAEEIQKLVPDAHVVKAFNTILAQVLAEGPSFGEGRAQVFVAANDKAAKEAVTRIVQRTGFDSLDAGDLSNARYLEPLAEQNIHFAYALGHGPQIAPVWLKRAA